MSTSLTFISLRAIIFVGVLFFPTLESQASQKIYDATEIGLPGFEKKSLRRDEPIQDFMFLGENLLLLGKHGLWFWNTTENTLRHLPLQKKKKGAYKLRHLATDGHSLYAASSNTLFQIQLDAKSSKAKKIYRYNSPFNGKGLTLGIVGKLDQMWWVHSKGILKIDRYGKTLVPTIKPAGLTRKDLLHFDASTQALWIGRKYELLKIDLSTKPIKVQKVLKTKFRLKGIAKVGSQTVAHTAHSVLRLDKSGKIVQSIPVEGSRKIVSARWDPKVHSFLFSDRLLERFQMNRSEVERFAIPLRVSGGIKSIRFQGNLCAILQNGSVRLFSLPSSKKKD